MEEDLYSPDKEIEFIDPLENLFDRDWIENAFIVSIGKLQDAGRANAFFTYADRMLTDSSVGGSIEINPEYQFTRYADVPRQGRDFTNAPDGEFGPVDYNMSIKNKSVKGYAIGNGRYYSGAIAINRETLILEFGVPKFRSMLSYYTRASDRQKSIIANEGRDPMFYEVGQLLGYAGQILTLNVVTVLVYAGMFEAKALGGNSDNRYYTLKPTMPDYWASVSALTTYMATERGVLLPGLTDKGTKERIGMPLKINQGMLNDLHDIMPEVFTNLNYIDVFAIAQRSQVKVNRQILKEMATFKEGRFTKNQVMGALNTKTGKLEDDVNYEAYLKKQKEVGFFSSDTKDDKELPEAESAEGDFNLYTIPDKLWTYLKLPIEYASSYISDLGENTLASMKDGGMTVALSVEYVTSTSISFTNTTKEIPAKERLNSVGGVARDLRFNFSGGNFIDDTLNDITNAVGDVASGALDSVTFGLSNVIKTLMDGGYMNFPKMYDNSTVSLPSIMYKIVVAPPYNNPVSKILDMDLVLSVILAGMLPQSVGAGTYTSPRLCKAFMRGKQNIDLGMITECTIRTGINNVAYSVDGKTLGLEITFTVSDFNEYFSAPVKSSMLGAFEIGLDENNPLNKYLSTLAGRDYHSTRYMMKNGLIQSSRAVMGLASIVSPAHIGLLAGDSLLGRAGAIATGAILDTTALYLRDQN
jgi:hypothetical protein